MEIEDLQRHLVFLKEDRGPQVVIGMRKYRYMHERTKYLNGETFEKANENEESILQRHWRFHEERGLESLHIWNLEVSKEKSAMDQWGKKGGK